MPESKLSKIVARIVYVLPRIPLEHEGNWKLTEYKGHEPLETLVGDEIYRQFTIEVPAGGKPGGGFGRERADDLTHAWYEDTFTIAVGYPDPVVAQLTPLFVSRMARSDSTRIAEALGRLSPFQEIGPGHPFFDPAVGALPALGFVDEARAFSYARIGKTGRTSFRLTYAEPNAIAV
jgi:hypothetical protein